MKGCLGMPDYPVEMKVIKGSAQWTPMRSWIRTSGRSGRSAYAQAVLLRGQVMAPAPSWRNMIPFQASVCSTMSAILCHIGSWDIWDSKGWPSRQSITKTKRWEEFRIINTYPLVICHSYGNHHVFHGETHELSTGSLSSSLCNSNYQRVNPIKSHETTSFLWFSYGFLLNILNIHWKIALLKVDTRVSWQQGKTA